MEKETPNEMEVAKKENEKGKEKEKNQIAKGLKRYTNSLISLSSRSPQGD